MPTIPRGPRRVGTAPLSGARVPVNPVPGALDPAIDVMPAARNVLAFQAKQKALADQMAVDSHELTLANLRTDLGEKVYGAKGVNALQAATEAQQEWQEKTNALINDLPNDEQKAAVRQRADNYWNQLYATTQSHTHAETRKADAEQYSGLLLSDLSQVTKDPTAAETFIGLAKARTAAFGQREGWTPDVIEAKQREQVSRIHDAALSQLLVSERFDEAQGYFNANADALDPQARSRAERLITRGVAQQQGEQHAADILALDNRGRSAVPESDAIERASQIADEDQRDAAMKSLASYYTKTEHADRIDRQAARTRLITTIEQNGGRFSKADPDWARIEGTPEGESVLHRQTQILRPPPNRGNPQAYTVALNLAALPGTRADFLAKDFTGKDGEGLNDTQRDHLINIQRHYRDVATHKARGTTPAVHLLAAPSPFAQFAHDAPTPTRRATPEEAAKARVDAGYADMLRMHGVTP